MPTITVNFFRVILLTLTLSLPFTSLAEIDPNAFYVDKEHPSANNTNPGTKDLPWTTIQHGVNSLSPGNRLYVMKTTTPYFEPYRANGANWGGITINVSGTPSAPIYIEGYPGERPTINQQLSNSSLKAEDGSPDSAAKVTAGFFLFNADYIVLKNFEITNTNASGIMFNHDTHNTGIIIEEMHIHHIIGVENLGGIRLDHADDAIVRNNKIHDIYSTRESNNPFTTQPYGLHSGIHGFAPGNGLIENNTIYNVARGIYTKGSDPEGKNSHTVRNNIFYNIDYAAFDIGSSGSSTPPTFNAKFYGNIVYDSSAGVKSTQHETTAQSHGLEIYNNTFVNVDAVTNLRGHTGIKFYNNIIKDSSFANFATQLAAPRSNQIAYIDNNLYFGDGLWILDRYGAYQKWNSLSAFQKAYSSDAGIGLTADSDKLSLNMSPEFIDETSHSFILAPDSTTKKIVGLNTKEIGAFGINNTPSGKGILWNPPSKPGTARVAP